MDRTDYGDGLTEEQVKAAYANGACPRCGSAVVDMRGTASSQFTLRDKGRCFVNGEMAAGFECNNKGAREKTT